MYADILRFFSADSDAAVKFMKVGLGIIDNALSLDLFELMWIFIYMLSVCKFLFEISFSVKASRLDVAHGVFFGGVEQ